MVKTSSLLRKINRRKIIKNLGQFISIIIITLLAVTLAVGLNSNAKTLEAKLDNLLEGSNFADGIVYGLIEEDDITEIESLVDSYQRRLQLNAFNNGTTIDLLISDEEAVINKPYTSNYSEGVYITHELAKNKGYNIGDTITLGVDFKEFSSEYSSYFSLLNSSVREGKTNILAQEIIELEFVIDGFMYHPEGIVDANPISMTFDIFSNSLKEVINENYLDSGFLVITNSMIISFLEENLFDTYNSILFKGDFNKVNKSEYFQSGDHYILDTQYISGVFQMNMDITQAYQLTYVFPVVFIIVSILIIITTISQLIFKEKLNIATLKSIGISNSKIYLHYTLLTITLCLIGGAIGSILGPLFIPNVMGMKYNLIYNVPNVSNVFSIFPIISNILLFVLISTIVSYFILRNSVNMPPAALIKNKGNHKFKTSKLKINSWSLKIAFRNISQNVFRSLMVIVGVGGCAALFITGFGIDDTLNNTSYTDMHINFACDATITFDNYSNSVYTQINDLEEIYYYEEFSIQSGSIKSDVFNLTQFYFIPNDTTVFNKGDFNGVHISSKIADKLNIKENDSITFTINDNTYEIKVEYIIETGFTHAVFIPDHILSDSFDVTNAWVKTTDQNKTDNDVTNIVGVSDVFTSIEFQQMCDDALGPIGIIKITLQVFAFLLGVVVLFNLALLNFKEKSRDIATLKVLGLTNGEISKSLIIEMMVLAILGGLLGLAIGYPLMTLLLSINEVDIVTYIYNLAPLSYFLTFAFTTITALVVNLLLFKQINKIKMVESLKSVE